MLARAEKLHRELFRPVGEAHRQPKAAGRCPGDRSRVLVLVALPIDPDRVRLSSTAATWCLPEPVYPSELRTAIIHRLELPQGRFERRVRLPGDGTAQSADRRRTATC